MLLFAAGCGGRPTNAPALAAPSASAERDGPETDYERKRRLASAKREQCLAVGGAVQQAQEQDLILNVNDDRALNRVAQSLDASATTVADASTDLAELRAIRDEYGSNLRAMADALRRAAEAASERERKPAISQFHEREARSGTIIEKINEYCNASVE